MSEQSPVIQVVFETPMRQSFDYLPAAGQPPPRPGERVRVSFGRQRAVGVVVAQAETSALPRPRLKPVSERLDSVQLWDDATFGLLRWAADYYHHPLGDVLFSAMPKMLRKGAPATRDEIVWRLSESGRDAVAGVARLGSRQKALIAHVSGEGATNEEISAAGHTGALRSLASAAGSSPLRGPSHRRRPAPASRGRY